MSEVQRPESDRKDLLKRALVRMEQLEAELRAERARASEPLAIVGIGCRFPGGANDPETFWKQLIAGFDATSEIPADRWDVDAYYDPDPDTPGTMYVRRGAFITQPVDAFDAGFFGIAPREADELDPQQRLLAEVVWETLERAGHSPASLRDSATGVYLGMCAHDWSRLQGGAGDTGGIGTYFGTGTAHSVAAGRIAYLLGLRGPALTIDTACSSSLVAFHVACQSLRAAETRMAIVCGVSLILAPDGHVIASRGRMLSRNGRCSTFDASADGYVRGEGCAVVLVKRLSDARADGDNILAVVHGTASNQDGRSSGLTAPSGVAQEEVMRAALAASRLQPADITYVETHGTGTELGDPIEVHALASVHADRPANRPLLIGSVKTNVGHLEAAAGLAGLIKTVLALRADVIPPHLHFRTPNPHIAWGAAPIQVTAAATPWPEGRRLAGLSSFGFSGTNAHVILEAATEDQRFAAAEMSRTGDELIVPLSARTMDALRQLAGRHADRLENDPALSIRDVARTLARGRAHWEHRAVVIAADRSALVHTLRELERGASAEVPGLLYGEANLKRAPRVAFLFTGQGSQRPGMGRDLLAASPVFRDAVEQCDRLLAPKLGFSVRDLLAADPADARTAELLQQTHITQPALFTLEYGLAMLWRSWGVEPSVMLGHSVGEYVAACVAGVLSLEDAVALIAERGRLMGSLPAGGAMATVFASEDVVRARLDTFCGKVDIAALNAPRSTVVSGDADAVDELLEQLYGDGIESRRLVVSHAFHSHRMEPILNAFRAAASVQHAAPRIDVIANVTGARATAETFGADYWARHVRSPVLFAKSIEALRAEGVSALIEAGPAPVLLGLTAACPGAPPDELHLPTLRPGHKGLATTWEALARLYIAGANIDWSRVYPGPLQPTDLPTYPFQRQRHWFSTQRATAAVKDAVHPLLGRRIESPRFAGVIFETVLHEQSPAWLSEHRVFGRAIVPAAAFLEMARAAVEHATETVPRLTGIRILEPLIVDNERTVQTIVDTSARTVEIVSRQENDVWRTHVSGRFDAAFPQAGSSIVEAMQDSVEVEPATLLARIAASGVSYGPAFSGLRRIRRSSGYVLAEITGAAVATRERQTYAMHPALLDAAFQACGAFIDTGDDIYLPVEVGVVRTEHVGTHAAETVTARIRLGAGGVGAPALVCDVNISDGRTSLHIEGLRFSRATKPGSAADRRAADWLYSWNWVDADVPAETAGAGSWRILGNDDDVAAIADVLQHAGRTVESANPRDLAAATSLNGTALEGVLFVLPQSKLPPRGEDIGSALEPVLLPLLETARAIAAGAAVGRLCVITRDAWPLDDDTVADPAAAASWGLGRTIAAELAGVHCRFIDISATESLDRLADDVANAVLMPGAEDRLALRADGWKAARLARLPKADTHMPLPDGDYCLEIGRKGELDGLAFAAHVVAPPAANEVTIRVEATGLNFRDVLNALGMYPGDAGPLGSECVGVIEAVGSDVNDLVPGDTVMAVTPRGFCSRVNAAAALTVRVPNGLAAADAATIPIAFLTADWALNELAGLRAGERVLIHAAAGGVGLAAVQLARAVGAEVFATVGSRRKREVLRRLGVTRIYDSRSTRFREQILHDTNGAGVHVVLNSLADEFIPAGLDVLAHDGRFIEIGKTGVWDAQRVATVRPNARYDVLYLGEACAQRPEAVRARFLDLMQRFDSGELQPLPTRVFGVDEAVAAFRFMAQAKHIGKIVLSNAAESAPQNDAVWITGGLGGVGLAIAQRLVRDGARQIALTGRSAPTADAEKQIDAMRAAGAEVAILRGDVSRLDEVTRIRDEIAARGWRLQHVHHAAAVLDDAALAGQNLSRFETALAPKAGGAWNLHLATLQLPLRSFVLYSAGAALLGSPGQANYAAANAFLDGLAVHRRGLGLPAVSIAWGPWADVGMAARAKLDWSATGVGAIDADAGAAALKRVVRDDIVLSAVLPIDWSRFPVHAASGEVQPFLSLIEANARDSQRVVADKTADWRVLLNDTPPAGRAERVQQLVADEVMRVLGLDRSRVLNKRQGLTDLGLDSLMAVELSNRISRATATRLPSTLVFEHPTVEAMGAHVLAVLSLETEHSADPAPAELAEADLAEMSADDLALALADELKQIGY